MRIGEINHDNYEVYLEYLRMLGMKNTKVLDSTMTDRKTDLHGNERVFGPDGLETQESVHRRMIKLGYCEEGMLIREGEKPDRRILPVSDDVTNKIIDSVRREILEIANGRLKEHDFRYIEERAAIAKEYRRNIDPKDRLAVTWTLSQIARDETMRIYDYIKSQIPDYQYGQQFDPNILTKSNYGLNHIDVYV